jgi:hypothetical protein
MSYWSWIFCRHEKNINLRIFKKDLPVACDEAKERAQDDKKANVFIKNFFN